MIPSRPDQPPASERAAAPPTDDDVVVVLRRAESALFGATALVVEILIRSLSGPTANRVDPAARPHVAAAEAADLVLGLCWQATQVAARTTRVVSPAVSFLLSPPLVPTRLTPRHQMRRVARSWRAERPRALRSLAAVSERVVPTAGELVIGLVDAERLVVRALERLDLEALTDTALAHLDLDRLVAAVVADVDVARLVDDVVGRLDLTAVVQKVARDIDLDAALEPVFDQVDLNAMVLEHVDLNRLVAEVVAQLDLTQIVLDNVDLVRVADVVIDGVDLPRIVRESSGSIVAETVDSVRLQGIDADRAVARLVNRLLSRPRSAP